MIFNLMSYIWVICKLFKAHIEVERLYIIYMNNYGGEMLWQTR